MKVLLLGSGGREHALAWKISKSELLDELFIAPGNAGTAELGKNINIDILKNKVVGKFVSDNNISMVVVGPEAPLVNGIYNYFKATKSLQAVKVIGPSKEGALLEGSKAFAKEFMQKHNIPTAGHQVFTKESLYNGFRYIDELNPPYVLKADGLAAGKGVFILETADDAKRELSIMLSEKKFGHASSTVVIEEYLDGIECSVFVLTDGKNFQILPVAKDYKRIGENDTGLNTGGMGAISPPAFADAEFMQKVENTVIMPTLQGLEAENINYKGFLYFGLMNCGGKPYVVEYNCRLGDPETQVVLPRVSSDLLDAFTKLDNHTLNAVPIKIDDDATATVVMASKGYPGVYQKGMAISGLPDSPDNVWLFQAGTKKDGPRNIAIGGRVLSVTAKGSDLKTALTTCYSAINGIKFENAYFRSDIGFDVI